MYTYIWSDRPYNIRGNDAGNTRSSICKTKHGSGISGRYITMVNEKWAELEPTERHRQCEEYNSFNLVVTVHVSRNNQKYTWYYGAWKK